MNYNYFLSIIFLVYFSFIALHYFIGERFTLNSLI